LRAAHLPSMSHSPSFVWKGAPQGKLVEYLPAIWPDSYVRPHQIPGATSPILEFIKMLYGIGKEKVKNPKKVRKRGEDRLRTLTEFQRCQRKATTKQTHSVGYGGEFPVILLVEFEMA
jgi:hypothetical protein